MSQEDINKLEERVFKTHGIYFGSVPTKEWTWFKKYAKDEWADNYGAALAAIIKKEIAVDPMMILNEIENIKNDIRELKSKILVKPSDTRIIKTVGGKIISR